LYIRSPTWYVGSSLGCPLLTGSLSPLDMADAPRCLFERSPVPLFPSWAVGEVCLLKDWGREPQPQLWILPPARGDPGWECICFFSCPLPTGTFTFVTAFCDLDRRDVSPVPVSIGKPLAVFLGRLSWQSVLLRIGCWFVFLCLVPQAVVRTPPFFTCTNSTELPDRRVLRLFFPTSASTLQPAVRTGPDAVFASFCDDQICLLELAVAGDCFFF